MSWAGIRRLRGAGRRIWNAFAPGALVLAYHRIGATDPDPFALCVSPQHFGEHLQILREHARPMQLRDLVLAVSEARVPPRAVVVTCDDGYADNLRNAKPLLERYAVPATVFVTSGQLRSGREFWWDELAQIILQPAALPEVLEAPIRLWLSGPRTGKAAFLWETALLEASGWNGTWQADPRQREHLYRALHDVFWCLDEQEQRRRLDELSAQAGLALRCRPAYRTLKADEVGSLIEGHLIDIGAHSVTHPKLTRLSEAEQRDEIVRSKTELEDLVGRTVAHFAYPYGAHGVNTVNLVRAAGFDSGWTVQQGAVRRWADRFRLPRVEVVDCGGDEFASRLRRWFDE